MGTGQHNASITWEQDSITWEQDSIMPALHGNRTAKCGNLEQDSIALELGTGQHYVETAMTALCHNRTALLCWNRTALLCWNRTA